MGSEAPYCLDLFSRYDASFLFYFLLSEHEKERQVSRREAFLYVKKVDQSCGLFGFGGGEKHKLHSLSSGQHIPSAAEKEQKPMTKRKEIKDPFASCTFSRISLESFANRNC